MSMKREFLKNNNGFTLVELMVTVFLTAIAVISIYRGYIAFSQSADAQQQVMEMQQTLRIGMTRLAADIRRAGINEEDDDDAGFVTAIENCLADDSDVPCIEFTMDLGSGGVFATDGEDNDGDGVEDDDPDAAVAALEAEEEGRVGDGDVDDDGERIRYSLVANGTTNDLVRGVWDNATDDYINNTIITNVEALDFFYFDEDGNPLNTSIVCPAGFASLSAGDMDIIERVEITLVVRATNEDFRFTDTAQYTNLQGAVVYDASAAVGDDKHVRRRALTMTVQIRNNI